MDSAVQGTESVIYVLGASAIVAYVQQEPGAGNVRRVLRDPANSCLVHAVNLCEVYYDGLHRSSDEAEVLQVLRDLAAAGLHRRRDRGAAFWRAAGRLKAEQRRVSLADCFCVTLAQRLAGTVLTCDHHEFDALVPLGLCPILFAR